MHRALSRTLCRVGLFTLALGGGALVLPSLAEANPACGKVVTSNVTLNASMNCTTGNDNQNAALFVGKNGITINLNGFSIMTNPSAGPGGNRIGVGIDNAGDWGPNAPGSGGGSGPGTGFNNVTVKNGNITGDNTNPCNSGFFGTGILAHDLTSMTISAMNVQGNEGDGLELYRANTSSVTGSHFNKNCGFGADMGGNAALTISDSTFNGNGLNGIEDGPFIDNVNSGSQATLNHVTANHDGIGNFDSGVFVDAPVAPYLVENSTANGNGNDGFHAENNEFNTITFTGNNAENNSAWGFEAEAFAHGTNNGYENDGSGGCHNVGGCHLNP